MSGLWKTHVTALTLAALLASSHTTFAQDAGSFQSSKPVFTFNQVDLAKALKGGHDGKLSLRLTIPGWFNDKRQTNSLKNLGLYLDPRDKSRVLFHEEGVAANPEMDPEVTKLHLYANGEYGMTGSFRNFRRSNPGDPSTETRHSTNGPGNSSRSSSSVLSPSEIRLILENEYHVSDPKKLDRLLKLIDAYLKSGSGRDLDKLKKALKDMGLDPNIADELVFRIRNGSGSNSGATGPGHWTWVADNGNGQTSPNPRRSTYTDGGDGSDDFYNDGGNDGGPRSQADEIYARYGLTRPGSLSVTIDRRNSPGRSVRMQPGFDRGMGYLPSPDAVRRILIENGITDKNTIAKIMDLVKRAQAGDKAAQDQLERELDKLIPDAQNRKRVINILLGGDDSSVGPRNRSFRRVPGVPGTYDNGDEGGSVQSRSEVRIPAPSIEMIVGVPHLLVYEFDESGNLSPVYYQIVDGNKAVDSNGKTIWQKNNSGTWELVDADKKAKQEEQKTKAEILKKVKFIDGYKIKSIWIESATGNMRSVSTDIRVDQATGQNVDHFLQTDHQTEFLRDPTK